MRNPNVARRAAPARCLLTLAALLVAASDAAAEADEARFERLWSLAEIYAGSDGAVLHSVQLSGRFQVDQAYLTGSAGEHSETNLRRMRLGAKLELGQRFLIHAEAEYDPQDGEPVYRRLTDAYVAYRRGDALELTLGKHGAPFTIDGMTSSKELIALDRSNLTNNVWFTEEYVPGLSAAGALGRWRYHAGIYSSGERNRGFGDSNGGEFWLGTLGYDLGALLGVDEAVVSVNRVDNDPDPRNTFTRPLEEITSVNLSLRSGRWHLRGDVSTASGYLGQSDLDGFMLMPFYDLTPKLQLVARYTRVESDGPNGVRFALYEREVEPGLGDDYREVYLGLNYYWYGHKLKLQTGLQYVDMDDRAGDGGAYHGWAWSTGIRLSW